MSDVDLHVCYVSDWMNAQSLAVRATKGDLLEFDRHTYKHWAVSLGNANVAHLVDPTFKARTSAIVRSINAEVAVDGMRDVAGSDRCRINNSLDRHYTPLLAGEICRRAACYQGPQDYHLTSLNCEHFAKWCRYGQPISEQVENASSVARTVSLGVLGGMAALGAVAAISAVRRS